MHKDELLRLDRYRRFSGTGFQTDYYMRTLQRMISMLTSPGRRAKRRMQRCRATRGHLRRGRQVLQTTRATRPV